MNLKNQLSKQNEQVCELGTVLLFNGYWFQNLPSNPKSYRAYRETDLRMVVSVPPFPYFQSRLVAPHFSFRCRIPPFKWGKFPHPANTSGPSIHLLLHHQPHLPPPTTTPNRAEHTITTHRLYPKEGQLSHSQEWKNLPNLLHQSNQFGQETECPPEKHCSRFNVLRIIFQTKCGFPDFGKRKTINCFLHED